MNNQNKRVDDINYPFNNLLDAACKRKILENN